MPVDRICHNCKFCTDKHESDKGLPNAKCLKDNRTIIEFHMVCDEFKKEPKKKTA